ncbi:MAG: autotransporter outer membrane beta-barrel domain-containing protein [Candidatus Accumulibacter sp.]|nr:autotransporter outer membrane beta-barrel domain-containing protein [Accumulibacter sp.]
MISGAGDLIKSGAGTLTLTGNNTYTGLTEVREGTLILDGAGAAFSNTLALFGNTTFGLANGAAATLARLDVHGGATYAGTLNIAGGTMNFYVPATMRDGDTLLTVTGDADITGSQVNVGVEGATKILQPGDTLTLLDATGSLASDHDGQTAKKGAGMAGLLDYDFNLTTDANRLYATVAHVSATAASTALSEGFLGGLSLLNQTADAVAGEAMSQAIESGRRGRGTFATLTGGSLRHDTGSRSRTNLDSVALLAGIANAFDLAPGRFTLGAFIEVGTGDYDTHNRFARVKGSGDLKHHGLGVLGRLDTASGAYAEGSLRTGRVDNDFGGHLTPGSQTKYDAKSTYYSAHVGGGKLWNLDDTGSLDLYGKLFWTRQEGDRVRPDTGDPIRYTVKFKDIDSTRARIGGRYTRTLGTNLKGHAGLAYEHEFDGKAKATMNDHEIPNAPKLKGGTGIAELGLTLTPTRPVSIDLSLQGHAGKREGATGSLRVRYEF